MAWIRACGGGSPAVPDGRTVTPINDVTIWQQCAGIANPTYTTLGEVLADVGVLSVLMASDNAVDYLVRCKEFIKGENLVPIMTSNTTPQGEAFASNEYSSDFYAFKAFDGDNDTSWSCSIGSQYAVNQYVGYEFINPVVVTSVFILPGEAGNTSANGCRVKNYKIEGSNDGTWTTLASSTYTASNSTGEVLTFNNTSAYRYYRCYVVDNYANLTIFVRTVQFCANSICQNSNAMYYIGQNNYASNTLLADSDWCSAICNSAYVDSVLNVKVPKMTSNTTPSGVASASTNYNSNYPAWYAFDENATTSWAPVDAMNNEWIKYQFTKNVTLKAVALKMLQPIADIKTRIGTFYVKDASDNTLYSISTDAMTSNEPVFPIVATNNSDTIKLEFSKKTSGGLSVATLQFYGREDV